MSAPAVRRVEVPESSLPLTVLAEPICRQRGQRDHPEQAVEFAVSAVEKLRHLICGVVVHVPGAVNEHGAQLISALAQLRAS